ncbi:hypothetical protein HELRODRAFT_181419 [Helobdella robusta]|uniref:WSC domain-containing protein n=1 Tax=Helobdella robusta TaxID=6412 RepID=T1FGZ6_HELRO|nr:hypothetical protein HELRODRAFT_181419 [Helobdella robusta]ESN92374.1 hypothetical protein HELRODRAFT_181419 [Helobdella robusta]
MLIDHILTIHLCYMSVTLAEFNVSDAYIGCFKFISSNNSQPHVVSSIIECSRTCTDLGSTHMIALRKGRDCFCVDRVDAVVASSQCHVRCPDGRACGAMDTYSVYKHRRMLLHDVAYFFTDGYKRDSPRFTSVSIETCAYYCLQFGFSRFCIHSNGFCVCNECIKENLFPLKPDVFECNVRCPHDENEICGCHQKSGRDDSAVYLTLFKYEFQKGTSLFARCRDRGWINLVFDIPETCTYGCKEGWKDGKRPCMERDCTFNNGDCGALKCIESVVNGYSYIECVCPYGQARNKMDGCEVFRLNLAFKRKSYLSSTLNHSHYGLLDAIHLTDGIYDGFKGAQINDNIAAWIAVELEMLFCVGYVKVYKRYCASQKECDEMNGFVVSLNVTFDTNSRTDIRRHVKLCGRATNESTLLGITITVTCESFFPSKFVIIQQADDLFWLGSTAVAELEVYEAGCDVDNGKCGKMRCSEIREGNATAISCSEWNDTELVLASTPFYGCYQEADLMGILMWTNDYEQCNKECKILDKLSVMKSGFNCWCADEAIVMGRLPVEVCKTGHYQSALVFSDCIINDNFCDSTETSTSTTTTTTTTITTSTTTTTTATTKTAIAIAKLSRITAIQTIATAETTTNVVTTPPPPRPPPPPRTTPPTTTEVENKATDSVIVSFKTWAEENLLYILVSLVDLALIIATIGAIVIIKKRKRKNKNAATQEVRETQRESIRDDDDDKERDNKRKNGIEYDSASKLENGIEYDSASKLDHDD